MRRCKALVALMVMVAAGLVSVVFATAASANTVNISISCTSVTFFYNDIPAGGGTAAETVTINGTQVISKTFTIPPASGTDTVSITAANSQTVAASSTFTTSDGTFTNSASQTVSGCSTTPPCPSGTSIHIRWHYSGELSNGSFTSGSWSATTSFGCPGPVSFKTQAMEGNLKLAPGATLKAGYDFTIPGNNNPVNVTFTSPEVTFTNVTCANGATPTTSTVTVPMPDQSYTSTNGGQWFPSGDQNSPLVYQGSISVPDICGGADVSFQNGGTFSASIS
jgi:hypothetical protein